MTDNQKKIDEAKKKPEDENTLPPLPPRLTTNDPPIPPPSQDDLPGLPPR